MKCKKKKEGKKEKRKQQQQKRFYIFYLFFCCEGLNNSTGKKRSLFSEPRKTRTDFIFIFRKLYPLIRGCYLKTTIDHEKNGWGDFKWQRGGFLIDMMEDRWYV